jgi:subtilisin family serine protease
VTAPVKMNYLSCLIFFIISFNLSSGSLVAQIPEYILWIGFTDKTGTQYSIDRPEEFLSPEALGRRQQQNLPVEETDLPVSPDYLDSLTAMGLKVLYTTRWFNAAVVQTSDSLIEKKLSDKDFILDTKLLFTNLIYPEDDAINVTERNLQVNNENNNYLKQISLVHGDHLHDQGYRGKGLIIAVLDAGFYHADSLHAFESLWAGGQIAGWKDFVNPASDIFIESSHGMSVLSIMGGNIPGELTGTAPEADYWLIRSEDSYHETRLEEANWLAAAEFADSVGADIINSSLGYSRFDDSLQNYTYMDMDGNTTLVTRAADMAARKGILVVSSAGNEGSTNWKYITAPADGDSVLAVGAVDTNALITGFSSYGPTYDLRVKPNTLAVGRQTVLYRTNDSTGTGGGTSFAAPIISGLAACLWQKFPLVTSYELLKVIEQSSNRYNSPDPHYGFGLPNFMLAESIISGIYYERLAGAEGIMVYPNPFSGFLNVMISSATAGEAIIQIFDVTGKQLLNNIQTVPVTGIITIEGLEILPAGFYILNIHTQAVTGRLKILKQ